MSWAMRVIVKRVQKSQFADLLKDLVSNDKVLEEFWVDVQNLVETRASPGMWPCFMRTGLTNAYCVIWED